MRPFLPLLLLALSANAYAGATPAAVRAEIDALLTRLQDSGCEFNRNGSWHSSAEAKTHLLRKLEYIEDKKTLASTEQFIELAASSSSTTNKPYEVRCNAGAAVPSSQWLNKELNEIRKQKK